MTAESGNRLTAQRQDVSASIAVAVQWDTEVGTGMYGSVGSGTRGSGYGHATDTTSPQCTTSGDLKTTTLGLKPPLWASKPPLWA